MLRGARMLLLPLALGLVAPGIARAQVYQWVDADGVTHYTIERRDTQRRLRSRLRGRPAPPALPEAQRAVIPAEPLVPEPEDDPGSAPTDGGVRELQDQIARDRATLVELISEGSGVDLASDPRVREIAERLPRLQAELDALQREAER